MSEIKEFEFNEHIYIARDHLAVEYWEDEEYNTEHNITDDEEKTYMYRVRPIITLYDHKYIVSPICFELGGKTGLNHMKDAAIRLVLSNDYHCTDGSWMLYKQDPDLGRYISRIEFQDCDIICISACDVCNSKPVVQEYVMLTINNIDPKLFDSTSVSKIEYTKINIFDFDGYKANGVKAEEDEYGLIHIHI